MGRLEPEQWTGQATFSTVTLIFQSRGHAITYPKLHPKNVPKASELWDNIEITGGEVVVPFVHKKCIKKNMDKSWTQKFHFDEGRGKNCVEFESAFY